MQFCEDDAKTRILSVTSSLSVFHPVVRCLPLIHSSSQEITNVDGIGRVITMRTNSRIHQRTCAKKLDLQQISCRSNLFPEKALG